MKHLVGNTVNIPRPTEKKPDRYEIISLFEYALVEPDENGLTQITLQCSQRAMKYVFDIEHLGYIRYQIRAIVNLTSRYSYVLFVYLENNRFRTPWEEDVDELKRILKCDDDPTYKEFKRFNDLILKKCQKEIQEKTPTRFSYEPIKKGRKIVALRFTLETQREVLEQEMSKEQLTFADVPAHALPEGHAVPVEQEQTEQEPFDPDNELWAGACNNEFSVAEMDEISSSLRVVPEEKLPMPKEDNISLRRFHYLKNQYFAMNTRSTHKKINNRFQYLMAMIKKDTMASDEDSGHAGANKHTDGDMPNTYFNELPNERDFKLPKNL